MKRSAPATTTARAIIGAGCGAAAPFAYPGGSGYLWSESWMLHGPYTGRGAKGYRRSDKQIREEACRRLELVSGIDASDIEVSVENCVITLRGTVPDHRTKRRAEDCVESIYGVRDVTDELRVSQLGAQTWQSPESSDAPRAEQSGRAA